MTSAGAGAESSQMAQTWGRVLIAGGTDWPNLGRKKAVAGQVPNSPDIATPHILRALSNYQVEKVFAGHSACHAFFVTSQGDAFVYGRNEKGQCGLPITPLAGQTGGAAIDEPTRLDRRDHFLPARDPSSKGDVVHIACGRSHSLLVTRAGQVYATGTNATSQTALPRSGDTQIFTRIEGAPWSKGNDPVVQVAAGLGFSLFLTTSGKVYACGSMEKGQLGNGRTGEHFVSGNRMAFAEESTPILVKGLSEFKIVDIACGQQHSIALDDQGFCYVWGFGGYGRLGLGNANDQFTPVLVPQFARENMHSRADRVYAGPTSSAVVDKSATFYLAGKWKNSGDGGSGQGWTSFRYMQALMGCKIRKAALGGVTLFVIADETDAGAAAKEATMNVAWGQNAANGELGLGEGKPRSATLPQRCELLDGVGLMDVAAGQNTTFFLARNSGDKFSELPRYPEQVDSSDTCLRCGQPGGEEGDLVALECEKCENPYHLKCCRPVALTEVPEGEWFCEVCEREGAAGGEDASNEDDGVDVQDTETAGAASATRGGGKPRGRPRGSSSNSTAGGRGGAKRKAGDDVPSEKPKRGRPKKQ